MPQSYDFISKSARVFCEKFQKKLEMAFFDMTQTTIIYDADKYHIWSG